MGKLPSYPLTSASDLNILLDAIGEAKVVMLGEASHGTHEYYTWRAAISRRLIAEKGFNFIAVEGDWPDCYLVNRYIKGYPDSDATALEAHKHFTRWPSWMWGNWEVVALSEWLKNYNLENQQRIPAGFFGLDVYSLFESLNEIIRYLERNDGTAIDSAKQAFRCFEPYHEDPQRYARATALVPTDCEQEVMDMLQRISLRKESFKGDAEAKFSAEQNALVAVNAERYYRAMIRGGASSWNVRDRHMMETLDRLLQFHGPEARAIVWEHNTHVGDARYTDMADDGMVNIGQLAREEYGRENVFIAGFGSYQGTVIAGKAWDAPKEVMKVPPGMKDSWEELLHKDGAEDKLLLSEELRAVPELKNTIGHRAIGVVYNPGFERFGNYVPTIVPDRYDAFLYIDQTKALHPLHIHTDHTHIPDLYPWYY